jgi:hypothetical protein
MLIEIPVAVSLCQTQIHVGIEVLCSDIEFLLLSFLHVTAHRLYGCCFRLPLQPLTIQNLTNDRTDFNGIQYMKVLLNTIGMFSYG